ncbi:uncharacterized protein [Mytilus edulis]|uniref:uncharacterized protein n=1 Tax=Mytilus edulis TaxID=6550 RepID=UPI0039EF028A
MNNLWKISIVSVNFGLTIGECSDGIEGCMSTIYSVGGLVIGILIFLAILAAICFGVCAVCGWSFGCLKTTEAPRQFRSGTNRVAVTDSSDTTRLNYPPPTYVDACRDYGSTNQHMVKQSTPPPSYSSLHRFQSENH